MINVTIWYEKLQEMETPDYRFVKIPEDKREEVEKYHAKGSKAIKEAYPLGLGGTLKDYISQMDDVSVTLVTLDMPEFGLPDELLEKTDVLVWWAHVGHDAVPDELAHKIQERVLRGMDLSPCILPTFVSHFVSCLVQAALYSGVRVILNVFSQLHRLIRLHRVYLQVSN